MLDSFVFVVDAIPDDLLLVYMQLRLMRSVAELRREGRMEWATGRTGVASPKARQSLSHALKALLEAGPHQPFPVFRIDPDWSADTLADVMRHYDLEASSLRSPTLMQRLADESQEATGTATRSIEHPAQIMQIYLHARLAYLESLDDKVVHTMQAFRALACDMVAARQKIPVRVSEDLSQMIPSTHVGHLLGNRADNESSPVANEVRLTPGVQLINEPLTIRRLTAQFEAACNCDEPLVRSPKKFPYGVAFPGACERCIKAAQTAGKMDDKTADARRSKVKLFCLLTGLQTVTEVEQHHFRIFEDRISEVHLHFLKKPKHQDFTWSDIQELADHTEHDLLGPAPKTFNTSLDQVSAVLKYVKSNEKAKIDPDIDTTLVRKPETERSRKKRPAFQPEEVTALFRHPVWHGCRGTTRRHEFGNAVEKDGLYFVPLIVAYTGARMEEIAGLTTDAIVEIDGHYGVDIRPHGERRLKNLQSERLLPLHNHLIALGLIEHCARLRERGETLLFPELRPKSRKKKFTSALRYNWEKIREIQLDGNPKALDGHSLRHTFNQFLENRPEVSKDVRLDILGHAGSDLNEENYGDEDGMPYEMKKAAIDLLPRVF
ncbi:MAG: site-specific integrase [Pseudomonadota bacterium]